MMAAMALTIGQLAKSAGIPLTTLRYYERIGLLKPEGRSAGNYRLYSEEALERLSFIRAAQATGFTLEDVSTLLGHAACQDVQQLIEARLGDITARLRDLRQVKRVLEASLAECRRTADKECPVVAKLCRR